MYSAIDSDCLAPVTQTVVDSDLIEIDSDCALSVTDCKYL
jgi:hypothetical protein